MPQEPLDYRSAFARDAGRSPDRIAAAAAAAIFAFNATLVIAVLLVSRNFGAFLAMYATPLLNICLLLVSLGCTPLAKRYVGSGSVRPYVLVSIFVPVALLLCDIAILTWLAFPNGIGGH